MEEQPHTMVKPQPHSHHPGSICLHDRHRPGNLTSAFSTQKGRHDHSGRSLPHLWWLGRAKVDRPRRKAAFGSPRARQILQFENGFSVELYTRDGGCIFFIRLISASLITWRKPGESKSVNPLTWKFKPHVVVSNPWVPSKVYWPWRHMSELTALIIHDT